MHVLCGMTGFVALMASCFVFGNVLFQKTAKDGNIRAPALFPIPLALAIKGWQVEADLPGSTRQTPSNCAQPALTIFVRYNTKNAMKPDPLPRITCLGIATSARTSILQRCLASYVDHLHRYGRTVEIAIADDSPEIAQRRDCRQWLQSFTEEHGVRVFYAGAEEKLDFEDRMTSEGFPRRLIHFMLGNPLNVASSPGGNRNTLLLHGIGELNLFCDDDSVCQLADLREGDQSGRLVQDDDSMVHFRFASDLEEAISSVMPAQLSVLAAHEELLGTEIQGADSPDSEDGDDLTSIAVTGPGARLPSASSGSVGMTVTGVVGDSGMPNFGRFMLARGVIRERFLPELQRMQDSGERRNMIRGFRRPIIGKAGVMMTTATGLDNRLLLPPFVPSGRAEDVIFGVTTGKCLTDVYTGFIPYALVHSPETKRCYEPLGLPLGLPDVFLIICQNCNAAQRGNHAANLRSLGQGLQSIGRMPANQFKFWVSDGVRATLRSRIHLCETTLHFFHNSPPPWHQAMYKWISSLRGVLNRERPEDLVDLRIKNARDTPYEPLQRFIATFGELLERWEEIRSAALRLRSAGLYLGRNIGLN
jgi:hypothetical protein